MPGRRTAREIATAIQETLPELAEQQMRRIAKLEDALVLHRPLALRELPAAYGDFFSKETQQQQRHIESLTEELLRRRMPQEAPRDKRLRVLFSLYKEDLLTMADVLRLGPMTKWEFLEYLHSHPQYKQVDLRTLESLGL